MNSVTESVVTTSVVHGIDYFYRSAHIEVHY